MAETGLAAVVLLAYVWSLSNGFVWDDFPVLVQNPAIRSLGNFPDFFTDYRTGVANESMAYYRPLRTLLYAVLYQAAGLNAAAFHALNIVLHVGNVLLAYALCCRWSGDRRAAWVVAAVFGLHPIQTEAVTNVTGLTDVLFTGCVLAALLVHSGSARRSTLAPRPVLASYALFLCALLSKEMAITLPLLIVLADWLCRRRVAGSTLPKGYGRFILGFVVLAAGYVALRSHLLGGARAGEWAGVTLGRTMLMQATVIEKYLQLLVFPVGQSIRHVVPIPEPDFAPAVIRALIVVAALIGLGVYNLRRNAHIAFGIAWFLVALLPVMNLVPLRGAMMGERFLYLPVLGLTYAVVLWARPGLESIRRRTGAAVPTAITAIALVTLSVLAIRRNAHWKDNVTVFESAVRISPESNAIRVMLIREYERLGLHARREEHVRAGAENTRRYLEQYVRLGRRAETRGSIREAKEWYERALRLDPDNAGVEERLRELSR